ncbi:MULTISPECIES: bile acid:sodium symporter [Cyanobium]|uniref:Transporter n=1 Tax=Cyanobium usitatum str. Tous TaxID=2116684 RepID=A0A2P7MVH9_9CYAN|nr:MULTISPECIES: bile acid:sodium symporter [Cyanobium]MCP9780608.1 bile acid:sodium symporter [Cyanobium sp. To12R1]PSJ05195.1 transporter [Cyanobium usitatum str. Tous]
MSQSPPLLVSATLFAIMFALGLGLPLDGLTRWQQHRGLLLRGLVGTCLLVPVAAALLLLWPPTMAISQPARFSIALMAVCPSAPLLLRKAGKQGGDRILAALLQVAAALAAIITIPLLASGFTRIFGVEGWQVQSHHVAKQVALVQLLPLLLGLLFRRFVPRWASRLETPLDRLANGLVLLLVLVVLWKTAPLLVTYVGANLIALPVMAALVLISLALGYGLTNRDPCLGITLALATSMRNPGLALLLASTYAPEVPAVKLGILVYLLITVLLSIPFLRWQRSLQA